VVVPRYPDRDSRLTGPPYRIAQQHSIAVVRDAGGERVVTFDLEAESGWPIYVHAKVCIVDDVWMAVGSDNLNRRSWTNDSEASCAIIDETLDEREPGDPAGLGDGARVLARETRLRGALARSLAQVRGGDALGYDEPPRVDHDLAQLDFVHGVQTHDHPVVSLVRELGHHEFVRLGCNERLTFLFGKREAHQPLVSREREVDDPPYPVPHPVPNQRLV
jgi:hypothetical protein